MCCFSVKQTLLHRFQQIFDLYLGFAIVGNVISFPCSGLRAVTISVHLLRFSSALV